MKSVPPPLPCSTPCPRHSNASAAGLFKFCKHCGKELKATGKVHKRTGSIYCDNTMTKKAEPSEEENEGGASR